MQYPPSAEPPAHCVICEDFRQYVRPGGQAWTHLDALRGERRFGFTNLRDDVGLDPIVAWLEAELCRPAVERRAILDAHVPHPATGHAHDQDHPHTHYSK